mgnify:CR=1 FL=1
MASIELSSKEIQGLVFISTHLGIQSADFYRLRTMYYSSEQSSNTGYNSQSTNSNHHYQTLKIDRNATEQEAKKAFRKLALMYHPDKYSGKAEKEQDKAEEQFIKIKRAYDALKREKGWE